MQHICTGVVCSIFAAGLLAMAACSSDETISSSACSSSAKTLTEAECKEAGDKGGCEVSRASGKGCEFERCKSPPECSIGRPPTTTPDAARDPKCDRAAANGLFSEIPPCADYDTITINGAKQYACKCGSACPCGYKCGSIALTQGGVISSVCAP